MFVFISQKAYVTAMGWPNRFLGFSDKELYQEFTNMNAKYCDFNFIWK